MHTAYDNFLKYSILDPTGNITALVESPVPVSGQPSVADAVMERHPDVEQVGFVSFKKKSSMHSPCRDLCEWPEGNSAAMRP